MLPMWQWAVPYLFYKSFDLKILSRGIRFA